ncbi:hypothetical protein ACOSP7_014008 [Xanthoceras sorbifolium]
MGVMHFSVRFLGSLYHFTVQNPKKYTLQSLICDVYLLQCSTLPAPGETFRTEIHVPWITRYEQVAIIPRVGSESPSSSYIRNQPENTPSDNVVDISSDDDNPSEDTDDEDYDAFNPVYGEWISEESDDKESFVNSDEVHINEEEGMNVNDADDAVEDEVDHDDPKDTQSGEDIMSDAASYDWDNDFMDDGAADSESDEENVRSQNQIKRSAFCVRSKWENTVGGWASFSEPAPL